MSAPGSLRRDEPDAAMPLPRPAPRQDAPHQGPGDLTLASIVLFTLGAYGVAAGAATGEEAVVAVGVFAFTLFVIGIVWPVVALAHVSVEIVAPPDATVGETIDLHLTVTGKSPRLDVRVLDPIGPWFRTAAPATGTIAHLAARRGVFRIVRVQMRTSMPLGVFVRTKTLRVPLALPTTVAPRAHAAPSVLRPVVDDTITVSSMAFARGGGDSVRSVRPYVAGDPARLVHWPSSARRGELVVKEHEPPPAVGVALIVDLRGEKPETAASRAMGIGIASLRAGGLVWCCTSEDGIPVSVLMSDSRALGRQLARATTGEPGEPPEGWATEVVHA